MNRAHRRRQCSAKSIRDLQARVEATGLPGVIDGLHSACRDCNADGELIVLPGHRVIGRIWHDDGCPAVAGAVDWKPAP